MMVMMKVEFLIADKDDFSISNVVYSNIDIEMWYDWTARLDDTKELQNCIWVMSKGQKIAGFSINGDNLMYPFLIPPFNDRWQFWELILKKLRSTYPNVVNIVGIVDQDAKILHSFGFKTKTVRQVMCCPTGIFKDADAGELPDGFTVHPITDETSIADIARLLHDGYEGGVHYEVFGTPAIPAICDEVEYLISVFEKNNFSHVVLDDEKQLAAVCIAGVNDEMPLGFAEITELCVLPEFRRMGIAGYMLRKVPTQAAAVAPVVKLCVTVGSTAENLYRNLGFFAGSSFTNMTMRDSK